MKAFRVLICSVVLGSNALLAKDEGNSLRSLLKKDLILKKKQALETKKLKKKFNNTPTSRMKKSELIDENSLSQLIYELWLIKNNKFCTSDGGISSSYVHSVHRSTKNI